MWNTGQKVVYVMFGCVPCRFSQIIDSGLSAQSLISALYPLFVFPYASALSIELAIECVSHLLCFVVLCVSRPSCLFLCWVPLRLYASPRAQLLRLYARMALLVRVLYPFWMWAIERASICIVSTSRFSVYTTRHIEMEHNPFFRLVYGLICNPTRRGVTR